MWGVGRIDFFFILILKKVRLGCSGTDAGQTLYVDFGGDGVDEDESKILDLWAWTPEA